MKLKNLIASALCGFAVSATAETVEYWDPVGKVTNTVEATVVTADTTTLAGGWYVVVGSVSCASITVKGENHLILADGCELMATGGEYQAGIAVEKGDALAIYGQTAGTGKLTATGGTGGAGIGGGGEYAEGDLVTVSGGTVTVNGGIVTATGGVLGAGIGGGAYIDGGTVTINGGVVTATGGTYGAGIGAGAGPGVGGGTVTINGGTVTARSDLWSAGIGGGLGGDGGTVTITGGRLDVTDDEGKSRIGKGFLGGSEGSVAISGGIFSWKPADGCLDAGFSALPNPDVTTSEDYPWAVLLGVRVTFGRELAHMTAAWTSGDGTVTNAISGTSYFEVQKGTTDLKVLFAPEDRYTLDKTEYAFAEAITDDCEIPAEDLPTATYLYATVTVGQLVHLTAAWTSGDGTVTNAINGTFFEVLKGMTGVKVIFTPEHNYQFVDVNETGVRELDSPLTKDCDVTPPQVEGVLGTVANPWIVGDAVTAYVSDDGTLVIGGTGAMGDFASAANAPWNEIASEVSAVTVADGVTHIGKNAFAGFADTVKVNGIPSSFYRMMGGAYGMSSGQSPSGAISGAEFEQVQIIDGKAYLDVSVFTSDTVTNQNWSVATNGVIEVPAPGKQGFFILQSKSQKQQGKTK